MAVQAVETDHAAMPREPRRKSSIAGRVCGAIRNSRFRLRSSWRCSLPGGSPADMLGAPAYVVPPPEQVLHALIARTEPRALGQGGLLVPRRHHGLGSAARLCHRLGARRVCSASLLSHWPLLGKSWYPYIVGFQSLPKVALAPLMVVWFGFGLEGKVFITAIITFFPVLVNMMAGYQAVEPERIELARSCNASEWHLLTKIIIPSCLPFLFAGLGVASVLSILGAVVGEFVGASAGLGMLLMQYDQAMEIAPLFAVILLLAVIGFLMNYAVASRRAPLLLLGAAVNASARTMTDDSTMNRGGHAMLTRLSSCRTRADARGRHVAAGHSRRRTIAQENDAGADAPDHGRRRRGVPLCGAQAASATSRRKGSMSTSKTPRTA